MNPKTPFGCQHCGGTDLILAVKISQAHQVGNVGLEHRRGYVLIGNEPMYADLCKSCGTITRFYVRDTGRNWITG